MTPVRDDGGRSIEANEMNSEKDDDFLSEMTELDTDTAETPEPEPVEVEKGEAETIPEATPAPEPVKENNAVPIAALKAEREKRQRAEAERQRLEAELAALRQQPATQQQSPDFYADPEGYVGQVMSKVEAQFNQRLYAVLDAEAREAFADYDEVMEELVPKVQANPALKQQIFNSPNPAKAAYQLAKQLKTIESMQDPVAYEAQMRARIKAELEAEIKAKADAATAAGHRWAMIDMRADPTQQAGRCMVWTSGVITPLPTGVNLLAAGPDDALSAGVRNAIATQIGVTVPAGTTFRQAMRRLLRAEARLDGTRWAPLVADITGQYRIFLGDHVDVWQE
jgi:hypothetical protein